MKRLILFLWAGLLAAQTVPWQEVQNTGLPAGARLFSGTRTQPALRAWYLDVDLNDPAVAVRPYLSTVAAKREAVPAFTARVKAHAAVNGGYFSTVDGTSYSTVVYPGQLLAQNVAVLNRDGRSYPATRSLFSLNQGLKPAVDWIYHFGGRPLDIYRYGQPAPNAPGAPAAAPTAAAGTAYTDILTGIGGGPTLLKNGQVRISYDEEVFWGSGVGNTNRDPRTAVGYTAENHVILIVVDGRQPASEGASLPELALLMQELGCVEAMNLDGGGSSQMSVGANLINRPEGQSSGLRQVPTILAVVHAESLVVKQKTIYFEQVIDSADPACSLVGSGWFESANTGYYGSTRSLLNTIGQGSRYAEFKPNLRGPAEYEIYGWWVASSNRCQDTPFIVYHQGRSDTVRVNQTSNGSAWFKIGLFAFNDDGTEYIRIADNATRGQYIVVDALRIVSYDAMTRVEQVQVKPPQSPTTLRVYPNPFNDASRIWFHVREAGPLSIYLYDRLGREVMCLARAWHAAGAYQIPLRAEGLASGLYFCALRRGAEILATDKLLLLR